MMLRVTRTNTILWLQVQGEIFYGSQTTVEMGNYSEIAFNWIS